MHLLYANRLDLLSSSVCLQASGLVHVTACSGCNMIVCIQIKIVLCNYSLMQPNCMCLRQTEILHGRMSYALHWLLGTVTYLRSCMMHCTEHHLHCRWLYHKLYNRPYTLVPLPKSNQIWSN